jgi:hypothetical protein
MNFSPKMQFVRDAHHNRVAPKNQTFANILVQPLYLHYSTITITAARTGITYGMFHLVGLKKVALRESASKVIWKWFKSLCGWVTRQ